jgi:integrase
MSRFAKKYIAVQKNAKGIELFYVRLPKSIVGTQKIKAVRLFAEPDTEEFDREYWAARKELESQLAGYVEPETKISTNKTFLHFFAEFKKTARWQNYDETTKLGKINRITQFFENHAQGGKIDFTKLTVSHFLQLQDRMAETPHQFNNLRKDLVVMYKEAIKREIGGINRDVFRSPLDLVGMLPTNSEGHHTWTLEEIEQFQNYWPLGTMPRKAFDLILFTGTRVSDAYRLGPQNEIENGTKLRFKIFKNRAKKPKEIELPILPELRQSLDAIPSNQMAYVTSFHGRPFASAKAFSQWVVKKRKDAGLPACCVPHGLRKGGATIAAENGATEQELKSIFGWDTLAQVQKYTRSARQKIGAESGIVHLNLKRRENESA